MDYAELEIGLQRRDADSYFVELRFSQPNSDADVRLAGPPALAVFDGAVLREHENDAFAYGQALSTMLFAAPTLRSAFAQARAAADSQDTPLRLRLYLGTSAPELHGLRWETLSDPASGDPLLLGEQLCFSRYLASSDWRPIQLRPRGNLRALAVVANPAGLSSYGMAPIDSAAELARARIGLDGIPLDELAGSGQATLEQIVARLRDGYDVLYLVCHGALVQGEPWLWLEDEQGAVARVSGDDLVARVRELRERPRLVVLASCQSGDATADGAPLAALGPRLAEAGVSAVLAMQGRVAMATVAGFVPVFFRELQRDGQIDRAVAVARGAVRAQNDAWMPVLYTRLRSGRIWYVPGFGDDRQAFEKWPALTRNIKRGQCTPILGTHLSESLLGSQREIAQRWAETYNFPLAPHQREDLPQVAQFLAVNQDPQFPREELAEYLRHELLERYQSQLAAMPDNASLEELLATVGAFQREQRPNSPHVVLGGLPFAIFITAATDNLLEQALRASGKQPQTELCRWNEDVARLPSVFDDDPDYVPSAERPLIFHLFGVTEEPASLVLTEDDYFDYLLGVALNKELIPVPVREALVDTALLFLGFRLEDWSFRVLFRSIMSLEGRSRRRKYANIAGQIVPEEGPFLAPERARHYLESYFEGANIDIFWGTVDDFAEELARQWAAGERPGARRR